MDKHMPPAFYLFTGIGLLFIGIGNSSRFIQPQGILDYIVGFFGIVAICCSIFLLMQFKKVNGRH
ncbi:hypothetical protein ACSVDA_07350 [Cytobacillus sp. Hm23]